MASRKLAHLQRRAAEQVEQCSHHVKAFHLAPYRACML